MSEIDEAAAWLRKCADEDECFGGTSEEWLAKLRRAADLLERSAGTWIAVEDRLPSVDDDEVLTIHDDGKRMYAWICPSTGVWRTWTSTPRVVWWLDLRLPGAS